LGSRTLNRAVAGTRSIEVPVLSRAIVTGAIVAGTIITRAIMVAIATVGTLTKLRR
jgi:hypothetical protein